jgi:serine/threonine protein kinase
VFDLTEVVGNRYEVLRTLGQGAFGHTFLARDAQAGRDVALKVLDARAARDAKAFELFRREADVLGAIRHHGIPEVFDSFQDVWYGAPSAFLAMEYVEGTSLAQIIDEKRSLDGADIVHLFLELLGILDYLHGRVPPILHRDIKPSNIILRPNGFPALVDFGSVRRVYMSPEESGSTVAGTYGYMPYEQYMGQATPSSDLYALAATFLHLLTGRPPRDFMNEEGQIRVPATLPGEPRLRGVIERLLRPSPTARFANARQVRDALVGGGRGAVAAGSAVVPADTKDVAVARPGAAHLARTANLVRSLPPVPRKLKGETKALMQLATPDALRLMTASEKLQDSWGITDYLSLAFFSVITAGILPIVFLNMSGNRKRRMKRFFRDGIPGSAQILRIELEATAFDEKLARVNYQFVADGELHRDSDTVLPTIADRMQVGDEIPILYMPDRNYDSVIVAVESW